MTLCFIFWGKYDGYKSVLACARARAGCPIIVISDGKPPEGVRHIPLSDFPTSERLRRYMIPHIGRWCSFSLARWHVLREFARKEPDIFPVFCADWDVMIFRNLPDAYAPFKTFDYTNSQYTGMGSAPYGINNPAALEALCDLIEANATDTALNDMEAASRLERTGNWKVGNLFEIVNGSVFDHSAHCGGDRFQMAGEAKMVMYNNGLPYFSLHDGTLIMANTIHLWGSYKTRADEVARNCGIYA